MNVCIISFSSRADGNCAQISKYIMSRYDDSAVLYCFSDFSVLPCGICNYECFSDKLNCPQADDMENILLEAVSKCDLAYFIVPNYCDYPCANYFIFCERSQNYFQKRPDELSAYEKTPKKFIVVSNTERENFSKAFSYQVERTPDILFLRARDFGMSSVEGNLLSSDKARRVIADFISK